MIDEEQTEGELLTPLNIVILPDKETSMRAIEMSTRIAKELDTYFVLDSEQRRPHITLYQSLFPNRNIPRLTHILSEIAQTTEPVELSLHKVSVKLGTFVFWTAEKSEALAGLHEAIVRQTNPLREGNIPAHLASVPLEPDDAEDVRNYGLPMVLEKYQPHLTITRIRNPKEAGKISRITGIEKLATFNTRSISICNLGDNGTISETVVEFLLKAPS